jgi:Protein of unknown function (DUF3040)
MLSDRERRTLASIERQLVESDPELARLFAHGVPRRTDSPMPTFLLVTGLLLMVLGSMLVTASVAVTGIAFALTALGMAYFRTNGRGWPATA